MKCILCLKTPDKPIDIFGDEGINLDMKFIITKHFWLEPIEEDENSKLICSSCWISVDTFHKFYRQIEEAHRSLQEIRYEAEEDDFQKVEFLAKETNFRNNNVYLDEDIKTEDHETTNLPMEFHSQSDPFEVPIKIDEKEINVKSDSESEVPLSELSKHIQRKRKVSNDKTEEGSPRKISRTSNIDTETLPTKRKYKKSQLKSNNSKDTKEEKLHLQDGNWLATCYAEETYSKSICAKELDKYLRQNIELSCGVCQIPIDEFASLHPHFVKFHSEIKPFVSCCGIKLRFRALIIDHSLVHKFPEYFKCEKCSKVSPSRRNLKEHLLIHNKNYNYPCEKCNKSFYSKPALDRHLEIHLDERPFKCDECGKFFATDYRLKQHVYHRHHYKKICEQCGQVFREKELFTSHLLDHTNQPKPFFECKICKARLSSKKILHTHMKFQHLESPVEQNCNVCGIKVKNIRSLKRHMNFVHKNQREHKCTMCDKAFKRALILKEHMTTHTGGVLYKCPHCPKTYNSNSNMYSHRKKKHPKEWEESRRNFIRGTIANASDNDCANAKVFEETNQQ